MYYGLMKLDIWNGKVGYVTNAFYLCVISRVNNNLWCVFLYMESILVCLDQCNVNLFSL